MDSWILALIAVGAPVALIITIIVGQKLYSDHKKSRVPKPSKLDKPVIAYKRAVLKAGDRRKCLEGVIGKKYGVSSKAELFSPGFHAYRRYSDAVRHPQNGNVFLEVLLSGKVKDHDLGWTATEQRVLQVIPHCSFGGFGVCKRPVRYYYPYVGELHFHCRLHTWGGQLESNSMGVQRKRISKLEQDYSVFKEHGIVVALTSGRDRFVPTKIAGS